MLIISCAKANVLISSSGQPLLADFGLSYVVSSIASMSFGTLNRGGGTLRWMAPELLVDAEDAIIPTIESDIWAYGMVIYVRLSFVELSNVILTTTY